MLVFISKKTFQLKLYIVLLHMLLWLFFFNSQNISGLIVHIKKLKTHYIWVLSHWNTENWVPSTHSSYSFDNGPTGLLLESKCVCNHLCTNYWKSVFQSDYKTMTKLIITKKTFVPTLSKPIDSKTSSLFSVPKSVGLPSVIITTLVLRSNDPNVIYGTVKSIQMALVLY